MTAVLTVVVPLRIGAGRGESDLDRFERLLWPSFQQNWIQPACLRWLVVCPDADAAPIGRRLQSMGAAAVEVVAEDSLLPSLAGKTGWFKQQLVKLAASERVATPHYLTLDADVMLLRRAGLDDLLPGGMPRLGSRRGEDHLDWWAASGRMLQSPLTVAAADRVMGVTPTLLETAIARRVLPEVARRNGVEDGAAFLFAARKQHWSEYTLYWLLALEAGAGNRWVTDDRPLYQGVFTAADLGRLEGDWLRQNYEEPDGPFFFVAQSTLGLGTRRLARTLRRYFTSPALDGRLEALRSRVPTKVSERARRWLYDKRSARYHAINLKPGLVSFTFDDFPRSAIDAAGQLEARGWRGTFYVASGLAGQPWHGERLCTLAEVAELARRGHEIGNHTHSHLRCEGRRAEILAREYDQSAALLQPWQGNRSFAYPHGEHDFVSQDFFGRRFATLRTVDWGVNHGRMDLNRLRGVAVKREQDFESLQRITAHVVQHGGWLIFYTHDVRPEPSPYGCTGQRFAQLLELVSSAGLEVVTVAEGARRIGADRI